MAVDVKADIEIRRPRKEVASFAMEAENDPKWIGGISSARRLTEPPTDLGTRVERLASFLGRRIEYVMEVIEYSPNELIVLRSIKSPFPMRVTYSFEDVTLGTKVSIRVEGDGSGFYAMASALLGPQVKRSITRDLKSLRALLEDDA
jgi:uncharacterized membrane protein